ncbi:MAG: AAA family ATPase [Campylobacteraceae bacterium]|jgi:DNA transposition AAA+ family ATPase|nr:AAA family ATPase [Campylobacteraceae bacterium]
MEQRDIQDEIRRHLEETGISQERFAKTIGVGGAYISEYLAKGDEYTYAKKVKRLAQKYLNVYYDIEEDEMGETDSNFVKTKDARMAAKIIGEAVRARDLAAITGAPGTGKTKMIKEYVSLHSNAMLIEATIKTKEKELFREIAEKLGINPFGSLDEIVRACGKKLKSSDRFFIIDEAEHLSYVALELLRRMWDFSERAIILVGTDTLDDNVKGVNITTKKARKYAQLYSRFCRRYKFNGLIYTEENNGKTEESTQDLVNFCSQWTKDTRVIKTIRLLAKGNVRKTKNLLKCAERLAYLGCTQIDEQIVHEAASMLYLD